MVLLIIKLLQWEFAATTMVFFFSVIRCQIPIVNMMDFFYTKHFLDFNFRKILSFEFSSILNSNKKFYSLELEKILDDEFNE